MSYGYDHDRRGGGGYGYDRDYERRGGRSYGGGGGGRDYDSGYHQSYDRGSGYDETERMTVSRSNVGRIIGKGGSKIKDLQYQSGCKIQVKSDEADEHCCPVDVTGESRAVQRAKRMIEELDQPYNPAQSRGGGSGGGGGYGGQKRPCYNCGKEGHFARECSEQQY